MIQISMWLRHTLHSCLDRYNRYKKRSQSLRIRDLGLRAVTWGRTRLHTLRFIKITLCQQTISRWVETTISSRRAHKTSTARINRLPSITGAKAWSAGLRCNNRMVCWPIKSNRHQNKTSLMITKMKDIAQIRKPIAKGHLFPIVTWKDIRPHSQCQLAPSSGAELQNIAIELGWWVRLVRITSRIAKAKIKCFIFRRLQLQIKTWSHHRHGSNRRDP